MYGNDFSLCVLKRTSYIEIHLRYFVLVICLIARAGNLELSCLMIHHIEGHMAFMVFVVLL